MPSVTKPTKVLLVDDERQQFLLIGYLLSEAHYDDYRLIWCQDLDDGIYQIEHGQCDVVLLDYHWGASNNDFIHRALLVNNRIPIIVMTYSMERDVDYKAISEGASDYLVKDYINSEILERTIRYSIERKKIEQHLDHLAHYDHLTDLPNRMLFLDRLNQAINLGQRSNDQFTLMYIDLNDFKEVNDNYGHDVGDKLLKEFAHRLQASVRRSDTVARIGGDEFTILLNNMGATPKIISLAQKLIENIQQPFRIGEHNLSVGCSIGIAVFPEAGTDAEVLQRHADAAMYQAKQSGSSSYRFFTHYKREDLQIERLSPEQCADFIENGEIELRFTPRIDLASNEIITVEVNPVWFYQQSEKQYYKNFAAQIDNNETVQLLTEWMISQAFEMLAKSYRKYQFSICFSIRRRQLQSSKFSFYVKQLAQKKEVDISHLEFSLLDKKVCTQNCFTEECIDNVNSIGAKFCLDNFGENTLSLSHMHRFDIPVLQLEPSLLEGALKRTEDAKLVETLITIAHKLERKIVADGVNTKTHLEVLKTLNCDQLQGEIVGEKLSLEKLQHCLEKNNTTAIW